MATKARLMLHVTDSGAIYCSTGCFANRIDDSQSVSTMRLPARPSNKVLDILLGRATCDTCGMNLEDLDAVIS